MFSPSLSNDKELVPACVFFSERTVAALELFGKKHETDVTGTVLFISLVLKWWTILNVKSKGLDTRKNQSLQAVICDPEDSRLDFLLEFGKMCLEMGGKQGHRVKQLSKDTAEAIHHTCCGIVELTKDLLREEHFDYVCLGEFTTDRLEKAFGKLRQGSGGAYFVNVQQVTEKLRISQAHLYIKRNCPLVGNAADSVQHKCADCAYVLCAEASDIFDQLPSHEDSISHDAKSNLVHIAGYVTRKLVNELPADDTYYYFEKHGDFTASLDRGRLNTPGDTVCQWTIFGYIMFESVKNKVCRTSLARIFQAISDAHGFNMVRVHCFTLANIFLNNFCKASTPLLRKEVQQKIVKLS